jgi:hypothetical protein
MKTKKSNIFKVKTSKNKKKIKNNKKTKKLIRNKIKMKGGVLNMSTPFNIPTQSYELKNSPEDIERYSKMMLANGFGEESIEVLKILLANTKHITFNHLIAEIKKTISNFEATIKANPFYLFIPIDIGNKAIEHKSNYWISKIFCLLMNKEPAGIITSLENLKDEMKDIIVCDDASYSGTQMAGTFYHFPSDSKHTRTLHILCPFISQKAIDLINRREYITKIFHNDENEIMIPFSEILEPEKHDISQSLFQNIERYPYYFDHRVADYLSSFPELYELGRVCSKKQSKCIYFNSLLQNCEIKGLKPEYNIKIKVKEFLEKCPPIPYRPGIIGYKDGLKEGEYTPGIKEVTPEEFLREFNR